MKYIIQTLFIILSLICITQGYIGEYRLNTIHSGHLYFYYDANCKDLINNDFRTYVNCQTNINNEVTKCVIDFGNDTNSANSLVFYGNSVEFITSINGSTIPSKWCSTSPIDGTKVNNVIPTPYNVTFTGSPTTSNGGLITMTGDFIRATPLNSKSLIYQVFGKNYSVNIANETKNDFKSINFKSNQYIFSVGSGAGLIKFSYANSAWTHLYYARPNISSITYDTDYITIHGDNFYTDKDLIEININSQRLNRTRIVQVSHNAIQLVNYFTTHSGRYTFDVIVAGITSNQNSLVLLPIIQSIEYNSSISKYNGGIVTISGSYLSGINNSTPSLILFGGDECKLESYTSVSIICKLPKSINYGHTVQVYVAIDGLTNDNSNNNFTYGQPKLIGLKKQVDTNSSTNSTNISSTDSIDNNQIIIQGLNLGNTTYNTTSIYFNDLDNSEMIKSISNDESEITINSTSYLCGNYSVYVNVSGINSNEIQIQLSPSVIPIIESSTSSSVNGTSIVLSLLSGVCQFNFSTAKLISEGITYPCKVNNINSTTITCNSESGTEIDHPFYLILNDNITTEPAQYQHQTSNSNSNLNNISLYILYSLSLLILLI